MTSLDVALMVLDEVKPKVEAYADRVLNGVDFLDDKIPNWIDKINLPTLDLADGYACVLGQLAINSALKSAGYTIQDASDGFDEACRVLHIDEETEAPSLGFIQSESDDPDLDLGYDDSYYTLNHMWAAVIMLRRAGKKITKKRLVKAVGF